MGFRFFRASPSIAEGRALADIYKTRCGNCGGYHHLPSLNDKGPFDDILDDIATKLFNEKLSKGQIHPDLYRKTADELMQAMHSGLGGTTFSHEDSRNTLSAYLSENIHKFSAAKSLTQQQQLSKLLVGADGNPRSFTDFRNAVHDAGFEFNVNYLKTEFETAAASAQMANQWENLKDNEFLEYSTVGDNLVRPAHAALDGLTLTADSNVWRKIWPPNDWACRCTVVPGIASNASTDIEGGSKLKDNPINPLFEFNPGTEKIIYDNKHPYYKTAPKQLMAVKNYGLKTVEQIYAEHLPAKIEMASESEFRHWWKDMPKIKGTDDIVLKDKVGTSILFDSVETPGNTNPFSYFKDHILKKSNQERWSYAANFEDIITEPNEIWSSRENGKLLTYYLKFFHDAPIAVIVKDKFGVLTAETMYSLTELRTKQLRQGILIYSKK